MGSTLCLSVVRLLVSVPGEDSVLPILHGPDPVPDMDEALPQLELVRLADGDVAGARRAWDASLGLQVTLWTLRCLGELDRVQGRPHDGADRMLAAMLMRPGTIEALTALVAAGRAPEALAVVDSLPDEDRRHGRIRFFEWWAALQAGSVARACRIMRETIEIADPFGRTRGRTRS
ncbi:hypothetical protein [Actinocrispum wychmicini]|uniref:Tetratricopeptide repeat protein n=1 Tax=Actinocrispum wychmicini TaxID=1213861 RepID=A0A4R2J992_9PSEU|nr:hypothetical protein [Actinocrispum wychmicini]TCO55873.1 hypothetical protein EV192_107296 [Actinocrispum wychmicini]